MKRTLLPALALLAVLSAAPASGQARNAIVTEDKYCLSLSGGNVSTGPCDPGDNQAWLVYHRGRNAFVIHVGDGNCLDGYQGHGQPVAVVACDGTKEQDWWLHTSGQLQNQRNNLCIDIAGGLGNGRSAVMWGCHSGNNQRFAFGLIQPRGASSYASSATPSFATNNAWLGGQSVAGGRVISAGGGNIIAAGGGNVISAGGGNVVSAGGLN